MIQLMIQPLIVEKILMWRNNRVFFFSAILFINLLTGLMMSKAEAEDSTAIYFAKQAGVVAGAAEACGQSIAIMSMRVNEVITVLANDQNDKTYALAAFQQAEQEGRNSQEKSQRLPCATVINDYSSLPILRADYQETVIAPLMKSKPPTPSPSLPSASASPSPAPSGTASLSQTPQPSAPVPTNPALAAATNFNVPPPSQQYVPSQSPLASGAAPPMNPNLNGVTPTNTSIGNTNMAQSTEVARLQLAQQLAQMAQTLVSNNTATPATNVVGINPQTNPQLNTQLYGVGANNPIFGGQQQP